MARPVLQARRLWATVDGTAVCRGVDLRVDPGEVVALVGDADGGRSALLSCLGLELAPAAGSVLLHGVDVTGADADRRTALRSRAIAVVRIAGAPPPLPGEGVPPGAPRSLGDAALIAALRGPYDVVLVDGAFDGGPHPPADGVVDLAARQVDLLHVLRRRRQGRPPAVVLSSRNLAAVAAVADSVAVLRGGEVVDRGSVAHVLGGGRWATGHLVTDRCSA